MAQSRKKKKKQDGEWPRPSVAAPTGSRAQASRPGIRDEMAALFHSPASLQDAKSDNKKRTYMRKFRESLKNK